uniref:Uncharacterized protein n=1 Tax=Rhizophora mucronata TaxID=61149 RepID=A0A2P2NI48_RHIMU
MRSVACGSKCLCV